MAPGEDRSQLDRRVQKTVILNFCRFNRTKKITPDDLLFSWCQTATKMDRWLPIPFSYKNIHLDFHPDIPGSIKK